MAIPAGSVSNDPSQRPVDAQMPNRWEGTSERPQPQRPLRRWRENMLLFSGMLLLVLAASMVVGAGFD